MKLILAIIISILVVFAPPAQPSPACLFATSDLVASLADAQAGARCLELPAGVYTINPAAGTYLNATADNLEIRGAGVGKTILQTTGITLTSALNIIQLHGANQSIHDLTIQIGTGYSGAFGVYGISVYDEATGATIERVEVSGGYTPNGAAGAGISLYRTWNHAAQFVTIRDCWIHDGPSSAIVVNSSNNVLAHNRIERIGTSTLTHGFYAQGGANLYDGNYIANVSGFSFHAYKQVPNIDGTADRFVNNTSIDPGSGHIVVNGQNNYSNPSTPANTPLARSIIIANNYFRNTLGKRTPNGVWLNGVPALVQGNILEDVFISSGAGWIDDNAGSVITDNMLSTTGLAPDGPSNYAGIRTSGGIGTMISNNRLGLTVGCCDALRTAGNAQGVVITGNVVQVAGSVRGIVLDSPDATLANNRFVSTGSGALLTLGPAATNPMMSGNSFKR